MQTGTQNYWGQSTPDIVVFACVRVCAYVCSLYSCAAQIVVLFLAACCVHIGLGSQASFWGFYPYFPSLPAAMDEFASMFASQSFWRSLDTTVPPETAVDPFALPWESNNFLARMGEAPIHSTPRLQPLDTTKAQVEAVIEKQRRPHSIKSGVVATAPSANGEFTVLVTQKAYKRPPIKWVPRKKVIPFPKKVVSLENTDKEEWAGAVAKWQALAEEAGPENSNLAKLLVDLQGSTSAEGIFEEKCAEHIKADISEVMSD